MKLVNTEMLILLVKLRDFLNMHYPLFNKSLITMVKKTSCLKNSHWNLREQLQAILQTLISVTLMELGNMPVLLLRKQGVLLTDRVMTIYLRFLMEVLVQPVECPSEVFKLNFNSQEQLLERNQTSINTQLYQEARVFKEVAAEALGTEKALLVYSLTLSKCKI